MRYAVCIALTVLSLTLPTFSQQQPAPQQPQRPIAPKTLHSAELKFDSTPFVDVLENVHKLIGVNIHVNWKALEATGIGKDTPITLNVSGVSVAKALELILAEASPDDKLAYYIDKGVLEITTQELADSKLFTRIYDVADLLIVFKPVNAPTVDLAQVTQNTGSGGSGGGGGGSSSGLFSNSGGSSNTNNNTDTAAQQKQKADDLVKLIEATVRPEIWRDNGGNATIVFYNNHLIIRAPRSVHDAISQRF